MRDRPLTVSVVIPVYNEARTVEELLRRVRAVGLVTEIIVVDDGSTDGTRELIEQFRGQQDHNGAVPRGVSESRREADLKILLHDRNRGKGAALHTGFAVATGDVLIVQDADLEYDPQDYQKLLQPIRDDRADVVYGVRVARGGRVVNGPVSHFFLSSFNTGLTWLSNQFTKLDLSDIETCYKAFRREILESLHLEENRFAFDPEFTSKIAALPCRVDEVAISYARRTYREGKKIGMRDAMEALWCVVKYPPRASARRATRAH
jgi:glycosyltransferase involved in cell wall biosynthesis